MEQRVGRLQEEKGSLSKQVSELRAQHEAGEEERAKLQERVGRLEGELRDSQAAVDARKGTKCIYVYICTYCNIRLPKIVMNMYIYSCKILHPLKWLFPWW